MKNLTIIGLMPLEKPNNIHTPNHSWANNTLLKNIQQIAIIITYKIKTNFMFS